MDGRDDLDGMSCRAANDHHNKSMQRSDLSREMRTEAEAVAQKASAACSPSSAPSVLSQPLHLVQVAGAAELSVFLLCFLPAPSNRSGGRRLIGGGQSARSQPRVRNELRERGRSSSCASSKDLPQHLASRSFPAGLCVPQMQQQDVDLQDYRLCSFTVFWL